MNGLVLFERLEREASQALVHHGLEARMSADGRYLEISRYRERYRPDLPAQRREVCHRVPVAALLRWMARRGV